MNFNGIRTKAFWLASAERSLKTFAQTLLALFLSGEVANFFSVNWPEALGASLLAAVISLLTSVASAPVGPEGSPSLVVAPPATPPSPNVLTELDHLDGQ